jgi:phosphoribosylanthranilate isomerase
MMRVRVKVCGITCYEDAALALDLGVDALGFNFYPPSPRFIGCEEAREIIHRLPPFAVTVGVFVNVATPDEVSTQARRAGVQVVQLHGNESPAYCRELSAWPLIKAVRIGSGGMPENLFDFPVQAILLDARDDRLFGGTGMTFDWRLARREGPVPKIILAGGLNTANAAEAIRCVRPYAVDVCSGVEGRPGRKDAAKLSAFMREVLDASRQL